MEMDALTKAVHEARLTAKLNTRYYRVLALKHRGHTTLLLSLGALTSALSAGFFAEMPKVSAGLALATVLIVGVEKVARLAEKTAILDAAERAWGCHEQAWNRLWTRLNVSLAQAPAVTFAEYELLDGLRPDDLEGKFAADEKLLVSIQEGIVDREGLRLLSSQDGNHEETGARA